MFFSRTNSHSLTTVHNITIQNDCLHRAKDQHQHVVRPPVQTARVLATLQESLDPLLAFTRQPRQNRWPDLQIEFVTAAGKVLASYRCDPTAYLMHGPTDPLVANPTPGNGLLCNQPHCVVFKPIQCQHGGEPNCGCLFAVVELQLCVDVASRSAASLVVQAADEDLTGAASTLAQVCGGAYGSAVGLCTFCNVC